jgi:lysophospholipase L1-like esterase
VNPAAPTVTWPAPAAISYGSALSAAQLNATANVPGSFTYTPAPGTVLHAGHANLSVTFTPTDATDYTTATGNVLLTVNPIPAVVSWPPPVPILYGAPLSATQLNATAGIPGSFTYEPSAGAVLAAGSQTLSVTFTPADAVDYPSAQASVTLGVDRATPVVTWTPSDPIAVNVALGASQLNAAAWAPGNAAPLAGTFVYVPAAGTTFTATGPQTLAATFLPADSEDYTTAEASIKMNVTAFGVACWGDSMTAGNISKIDEGNYPSDLSELISLPVKNLGIAGQTSTEIGVREGGVQTTVTVAGGVIPASGSVAIVFPAGYAPFSAPEPIGGITGTVLGVAGRVDLSSGVFTFTRTTAGSPVDAPSAAPFVVDTPYAAYLPIFWEGQNNSSSPAQVLSDLAAQVATVAPGQTFLVLSLINYNTRNQWIGGSVYNEIIGLNNQLANTYGSHYLDIRAILVSNFDPTQATDVSDFEHDEVPTSLRAALRSGTLANSIGPADTILQVDFNPGTTRLGNILTIDTGENAENVEVIAADGESVTVVRNYGGLNGSHAAGAAVLETDYIHPNGKGDQIIANAIARVLSAYQPQAQQGAEAHDSPAR